MGLRSTGIQFMLGKNDMKLLQQGNITILNQTNVKGER